MTYDTQSKVQTRHRKRSAYLYVRQSSLRQVFENSESTKRQYELRQRAVALGWQVDQVVVIDSDQGQSGKFSADREGFQRLVTEVSLGRAGIVMGLEVSRLARNSSDWHRLLEICALTDTLVLDDDGLFVLPIYLPEIAGFLCRSVARSAAARSVAASSTSTGVPTTPAKSDRLMFKSLSLSM